MFLAETMQLYLAQASLVYGSKNAEFKDFIHQKAKINSKKPEVLFSLISFLLYMKIYVAKQAEYR